MAFSLLNCSKDDSGNEPSVTGGGKVYRYQSVLIEVSNMELSQNYYTGTFGAQNISVLKVDSSTLTFMIPGDASLGDIKLSIPGLNNTKLTYNVLQPTLAQTPQETVAPLISKFETFFTDIETPTLESGIAKNNYLQFKNYWDSTATDVEKEQIALWYQTNKILIDEIFHLGNSFGGRMMNKSASGFGSIFGSYKHIVGRVVAIAGVGLTVSALTATTVAAAPVLLGLAVISVGIKYCNDGNDEILIDIKKGLNLEADGLSGNNGRMLDNSIKLISDEMHTASFRIKSETLSQDDANSSNNLLKEYFSTTSILNNTIDQVDNTIDWMNSKKATSYQPFDEVVIPANSVEDVKNVSPETMQGIKFSINHPNLKLISATLASDGQLNLKVKVIGEPTINPVVSTLNYSYSDEISEFSGHFEISVANPPDKVIHYDIAVDGVNYAGIKNLYSDGGDRYDDYYSNSFYAFGSGYPQNLFYVSIEVEKSQDETITFVFQDVNFSLSGNYELKYSLIMMSNSASYLDYYANSGTIFKTGSSSFTFSGVYKSTLGQINVSGSVIVE